MAQKDYPELEGKEVVVYGRREGEKVTGVISGCSYDIGLTVQSKNGDRYYLCFNGPMSPVEVDEKTPEHIYRMLFYSTVARIKSKKRVDCLMIDRVHKKLRGWTVGCSPSQERCPFNQ